MYFIKNGGAEIEAAFFSFSNWNADIVPIRLYRKSTGTIRRIDERIRRNKFGRSE